jgi:hypothetical protein
LIEVIEPLRHTYVYGYAFAAQLMDIAPLTPYPVAMNTLLKRPLKRYLATMQRWVDVALA